MCVGVAGGGAVPGCRNPIFTALPPHLSRHGLLFNTVGYLERFSLQCPRLLNLFPGHVDIRGKWMWLTDWL